jgi:hypothetical protein
MDFKMRHKQNLKRPFLERLSRQSISQRLEARKVGVQIRENSAPLKKLYKLKTYPSPSAEIFSTFFCVKKATG